jgi:NAD dependent epimerase/dehydratase family enzyme
MKTLISGASGLIGSALAQSLGGRLGSGRQYISWITLDDVTGAVGHVLADDALDGPVNLVAP